MREALPPLDLVMSTAEGLAALVLSRRPDELVDARLPAPTTPTALSVRGGTFGSEAPSSISGSTSSTDDNNSAGIIPESKAASGTDVPAPDELVEPDEAGGASGLMSSSTPCASRSSSEFIGLFDVAGGGGDAGLAAVEGRAPPTCDAVPFIPKGSSTGRSAKGSKAGREAASIVFEPAPGRSILNVSCSAAAEVPRRWLTDRRASPSFVTCVTFPGPIMTVPTLQNSDERSSILGRHPIQGRR
jgi:hypothetical protein